MRTYYSNLTVQDMLVGLPFLSSPRYWAKQESWRAALKCLSSQRHADESNNIAWLLHNAEVLLQRWMDAQPGTATRGEADAVRVAVVEMAEALIERDLLCAVRGIPADAGGGQWREPGGDRFRDCETITLVVLREHLAQLRREGVRLTQRWRSTLTFLERLQASDDPPSAAWVLNNSSILLDRWQRRAKRPRDVVNDDRQRHERAICRLKAKLICLGLLQPADRPVKLSPAV